MPTLRAPCYVVLEGSCEVVEFGLCIPSLEKGLWLSFEEIGDATKNVL